MPDGSAEGDSEAEALEELPALADGLEDAGAVSLLPPHAVKASAAISMHSIRMSDFLLNMVNLPSRFGGTFLPVL
jgi:hypothetical protein